MQKIIQSLQHIRRMFRTWLELVLEKNHNYYSCYLPENVGLMRRLFNIFFAGIDFSEDQKALLKKVPPDAIIIYACKYKSYFEYLFYHTRYNEHDDLKVPLIGFDFKLFLLQPVTRVFKMILAYLDYIYQNMRLPNAYSSGYIRNELNQGYAAMLSLVEKKGFYRRFVKTDPDPLRYLIDMQLVSHRPIYIVPQLIFYSKKPQRTNLNLTDIIFGSEEKPGWLRRLFILVKSPGKVFVEISEPFNLLNFLNLPANQASDSETLSLSLRRHLLIQVNHHRQSIIGPILKTREELKEDILTQKRLRVFLHEHAAQKSDPLSVVYKEASGHLDEIASRYSLGMINAFSFIINILTKLMFEGGINTNQEALHKLKVKSRQGLPLIFVPCHKSHIDYLIVSYILYKNNMACPHIAAGKNLSFWPMGPIFRGGGAFFLRRTFKGQPLYAHVFSEYFYKIIKEGFGIEFFIEGGRSRTGKLLRPKFGLLSMLLQAYKEKVTEDLLFVPVFIGYDRVIEENAYLNELGGGQKNTENVRGILGAGKFLKKKYGCIYVHFQEPFSLKTYLAENKFDLIHAEPEQAQTICRGLGFKILNAIDNTAVMTPHAVVAAAILNTVKKRFSYDQLMSIIEIYLSHLNFQNSQLTDTLIVDSVHAIDSAINYYLNRKCIDKIEDTTETSPEKVQYKINTSRRPVMEYYKNNGIIFFITSAYTGLAILEKDAFQFSIQELLANYTFLKDFFKNEFAYDIEKSAEFFLRKNIKSFIDQAILTPHPSLPDTFNITSAGFRKLHLFANFLKTYLESYWIVLNFFMRYPADFTDSKNRLKKIQSIGNRLYKRKEIERPESLSKVSYTNAVDFFISRGLLGVDDTEKIDYYTQAIQRYLKVLNVSLL